MTVVRTTAAAVVSALALVLIGAGPAYAHAGLLLTVNDDGRGSVSVDIAWSDGHPVSEAVAGTLTAVPVAGTAAEAVGPVPLTRLPGRPTIVYGGVLPAGTWDVTVDVALPGIGHCAAPVVVAANGATAGSTRCGDPVAATPAATAPRPDEGWPLWATAAVVALAVSGAVVLILLRRWWSATRAAPVRRRPAGRGR
jgi:hypothetical protein